MQQRPVGICDICGNYAYRMAEVGHDCQAHHHGQRCSGQVLDASGDEAWEVCPACSEKRMEQIVDCPQCAGAGWLPR